jgi:hypothetical protein
VGFRGREVSVSAMIEETRTALGVVLPLTDSEHGFLDAVLERGEIKPEMLTTDAGLADRIRRQPMLEWKARHAQVKH